jgi:hypothetical protein
MPNTFPIAKLWPSLDEFAEDIGVRLSTVRVWRCRNAIPSSYWFVVEAKARERRIKGATCNDLARIDAVRNGK